MNDSTFEVWTISDEEAGQRLDVALAARFSVSRARAQKMAAMARLNEQTVKASHTLKLGDILTLAPLVESSPVESALDPNDFILPPILYEDDDVIVLNKPRGLIVHAGAGEPQSTLVDVLRAHNRTLSNVGPSERAGIVHRLDKETSGVMLVCKTDAAHWKLAKDWAERRVRKNYLAVVCGVPRAPGRVEAPIARHPRQRQKMAVVLSGRPAVTEFRVVRSWSKFALLDIDLLTGRTHQIRVHLAYVNYPVAGDALYSGAKRALETAPNEQARTALKVLCGQALHAASLQFVHPTTGATLRFETPPPPDMQAVIDALDETI